MSILLRYTWRYMNRRERTKQEVQFRNLIGKNRIHCKKKTIIVCKQGLSIGLSTELIVYENPPVQNGMHGVST